MRITSMLRRRPSVSTAVRIAALPEDVPDRARLRRLTLFSQLPPEVAVVEVVGRVVVVWSVTVVVVVVEIVV